MTVVAEAITPDPRPTRKRRAWKRWLGWAVVAALLAFVAREAITWPNVGILRDRPPATSAYIERARAGGAAIRWSWVPAERIAVSMKLAVVIAEDGRFFEHGGFDHIEARLAVRDAIREKEFPRGASTITQQLARNLWLSPSRDPIRKVKEALLTAQLERALSKERILELYLNVVQFGPAVFGVEEAALANFGIHASELNDEQAAALAALLPAPGVWSVKSGLPRYDAHRARILSGMRAASELREQL